MKDAVRSSQLHSSHPIVRRGRERDAHQEPPRTTETGGRAVTGSLKLKTNYYTTNSNQITYRRYHYWQERKPRHTQ